MIELKACPFCGDKEPCIVIRDQYDKHCEKQLTLLIVCGEEDCNVDGFRWHIDPCTDFKDGLSRIIDKWNTRNEEETKCSES